MHVLVHFLDQFCSYSIPELVFPSVTYYPILEVAYHVIFECTDITIFSTKFQCRVPHYMLTLQQEPCNGVRKTSRTGAANDPAVTAVVRHRGLA